MKTLKLDLKKWRCGGVYLKRDKGVVGLGDGPTELDNMLGFQCCIGQFCEQLGAKVKDLAYISTPSCYAWRLARDNITVPKEIEDLFVSRSDHIYGIGNTKLTRSLMQINDSNNLTIKQKIQEIKDELFKVGYELEVENLDIINSN